MNANLPKSLLPFQEVQKRFSQAIRDPENHPHVEGIEKIGRAHV